MTNNKPNGTLYLGRVKWNNDYLNVVDFKSETKRNAFFKERLKKINANVLYINPNGEAKIDQPLKDVENYNYAFYSNDDKISPTFFCCFITNWRVTAQGVTVLKLELDVFQHCFYSASFYRSFIQRGHVASDTIGRWVAPEPVGFASKFERNLTAFNDLDFSQRLTIAANSVPEKLWDNSENFKTNFIYGGGSSKGLAGDVCGTYRLIPFAPGISALNRIVHTYGFAENANSTTNHYNDLIGFQYIPNWVYLTLIENDTLSSVSGGGVLVYYPNDDGLIKKSDTITLDSGMLACGYTPRNKKMLTSLAKAYKIWNKNGLSIPLAPELLGSLSSLKLTLNIRPMSDNLKIEINNYADFSTRYFNIPFSFSVAMGFNSNVGVATETAKAQLQNQIAITKVNQVNRGINTAVSAINGVAGVALNAATGNISGAVLGGVGAAANVGTSVASQVVENRAENYNNQVAANDLLNSIGKSIGTSSDRTDMSADFFKLRIADCSPLYRECEILDDYLDMFGYEIDELYNPRQWLDTRPNWNYIKTKGVNLTVQAPNDYENVFKSIFNNGVTIWHNYETFGDYTQNNKA